MDYVTYGDIAQALGVSRRALYVWVYRYKFQLPKPLNPGKRPLRYPPSVVDALRAAMADQQSHPLKQERHASAVRASGHYTMDDLCQKFSISKHTIYNYISLGAISPPAGGRRYAHYTDDHIRELEDIRQRNEIWRDNAPLSGTPARPGSSRSFSSRVRAHVWEQSNGICHYCSRPLNPFRNFSIDHVVPFSLGGTEDFSNLVAACKTCNSRKHAKPYDVFVERNSTPNTIRD